MGSLQSPRSWYPSLFILNNRLTCIGGKVRSWWCCMNEANLQITPLFVSSLTCHIFAGRRRRVYSWSLSESSWEMGREKCVFQLQAWCQSNACAFWNIQRMSRIIGLPKKMFRTKSNLYTYFLYFQKFPEWYLFSIHFRLLFQEKRVHWHEMHWLVFVKI